MNTFQFCPRCSKQLVLLKQNEKERWCCPDKVCGFVHYNNPTPVVAAIVEVSGKIVLVRQPNWPEKMFGLITGFLESNETPEQGILREIEEETNLKAQTARLVGVYSFAPKNEVIIAFHVVASGEISLSEELAEFKLVPTEKLKPWPFGTGLAVQDWLTNQQKS